MITLTKVYFCLIILWVCFKQIKLNYIEYQPNEVVTIVGTVDGGIHGINRNRERVWSSSTGGQMVASQNHEPIVSYDSKKEIDGHMDRQGSDGGLHHVNKDYYSVLTAIDGSIIHQTHDGMRKTSVTARFLTEQTPFISKEGLVFTGKKSSKIMGFDVNTGKMLFDNGEKIRTSSVNTLPAIKKLPTVHSHSPVSSANSIWFGRVDYSLRAIDSSTGKEQFNLTYSELHPLLSQSAPSHHYSDAAAEDDPLLVGKQELNALALIGSPKAGMTAHPSRPLVELVSTPNGELYFSDSDGKLLDKVPISLKSPAMTAFDLIRKSDRSSGADSSDSEIKNSHFDIRSINVNHRIITPLLTSIASAEEDRIVLLQSPHSALGTGVDSIYALPVSTMQTDYPQSNADRSNDAKALTPILSSVYHNDNAVEEFDGNTGVIEDLDDDGNVLDTAIPLRSHVGGSKGRRLAVKSLKILSHLKELSNVLSTTPVPISQLSQHGGLSSPEDKQPVRETPLVIVDGLDCENRLFSAYYYSDELSECKLCRRNFNVVPCDSAVAVHSPTIRGQHRLRDEVYEGGLFNPHIQIASLFGGVLDSDGETSRRNTIRSYDEVVKSPFEFNASEFKAAIQISYYQKVLQIVEHLALYCLVILVSMVVVLIGIVYFIRSSAQYSHLLPSGASFLEQIFFVVQQLFERLIITAVSNERRAENPSVIADSSLKNTKSESYIESVDADGKRIVRIGSLVVHVEDVLGHGSHGTIVCRGSLNGRPLAVKRVLAQFTKEADREISLLIRSDGHPNVVRYFLKEEKRDFVYLGLQLCEMSLKDFIANIKGNLEAMNHAKAKSFYTSDARVTSMISEEVKSSLFQVAQGLAHLHTQRIVHRDIKPHNILLANPNEHSSVVDEPKMKLQKSCGSPVGGDDDCSLDRLSNYILKISDMGLSKQLDHNEHSFSSLSFTLSMPTKPKSHDSGTSFDNSDDTQRHKAMIMLQHQAAVGTVGWQAPELIRRSPQSNMDDSRLLQSPEQRTTESPDDESDSDESIENAPVNTSCSPTAVVMGLDRKAKDERHLLNKAKRKEERKRKKRTLKVDVFSLGCVFYYVLTTGDHPFGEWFERESNIITGTVNLSGLQSDRIAVDLIAWMLDMDPLKRPSSKEVCKHLFFWSYAKRLEFLVEFSDRLEHEQLDAPIMLAVEAYSINANSSTSIIGTRWDRRLDPLLLEDMKKFRKYDTSSIRDLLRVIRNKRHHFNELSTDLKASIGSLPNGFYSYFHHRFPSLLLHCADVANKHLSNEKTFSIFLSSISPNWRYRKADSNIPSSARMKQDDSSPGIIVETIDEAALIMSSTTNSVTWDSNLKDVVVLQGSVLEASLGCEGWWRNSSDWIEKAGINNTSSGISKKQRASHLTKSATDLKYRTRLCSHWEMNMGGGCPMRKKGKCIFAHGPLELRVKESRRDKWGKDNATTTRSVSAANDAINTLRYSGGEDVLGAARLLTSVGDKPIINQNDSNTFMSNYNMQQYLVNPYMMPMQSNAMYYSGHTVYYPNYTATADASSVTYQHATNDNHTTTTINK